MKKYVEVEVPVEVTKVLKDLGNTRFDERSCVVSCQGSSSKPLESGPCVRMAQRHPIFHLSFPLCSQVVEVEKVVTKTVEQEVEVPVEIEKRVEVPVPYERVVHVEVFVLQIRGLQVGHFRGTHSFF